MDGKIDARLRELGVTLPASAPPAANYIPAVRVGDMVYISGQISQGPDGLVKGKVGADLDIAAGAAAARLCGIGIVAQLSNVLGGDLDRVVRAVKLTGFVNSVPDFTDQPKVINGCSDFLVEVFGDAGRHARSAISAGALPLGVAVEVEAIFQVR
jgi:enamine deaminase RidA (YjgF/YER057c/UK114 family)